MNITCKAVTALPARSYLLPFCPWRTDLHTYISYIRIVYIVHTHTYTHIHTTCIMCLRSPLSSQLRKFKGIYLVYIHTRIHSHIHTYILGPYIHTLAVIIRVFNTSSGVVRAAAKDPATMPTTRFSNGLGKHQAL